MGTDLVKHTDMFSPDEIQVLIANKIIPSSATQLQIKYFFEVCKRKGLDSYQKQVHMIERRESDKKGGWITSYTIQASLDGMRAIAQRNCKIISYKRWTIRKNEELYGCCEISTSDRGLYSDELPFNEYCQKTKEGYITHFWKQFPETMIKKCAEESVLRMLAPEDLSGVYGDDEMMQAEKPVKELPVTQPETLDAILDDAVKIDSTPPDWVQEIEDSAIAPEPKQASKAQIKALYATNGDNAKLTHDQLIWLAEETIKHELAPDPLDGKKHLSTLTDSEASLVIDKLRDGDYIKSIFDNASFVDMVKLHDAKDAEIKKDVEKRHEKRKEIGNILKPLVNDSKSDACKLLFTLTGYADLKEIPANQLDNVLSNARALKRSDTIVQEILYPKKDPAFKIGIIGKTGGGFHEDIFNQTIAKETDKIKKEVLPF